MATDEEVAEAKRAVRELRAELDQAKTGGTEHQKSVENDITLNNLAAEAARLRAEIDVANERNKASVVERGAAAPLGTAKEQMAAAVAHQKAVASSLVDAEKSGGQPTPTDADETNVTTTKQAANKAVKPEGAK